jgi:hypothetical protein
LVYDFFRADSLFRLVRKNANRKHKAKQTKNKKMTPQEMFETGQKKERCFSARDGYGADREKCAKQSLLGVSEDRIFDTRFEIYFLVFFLLVFSKYQIVRGS